MHTCQTRVAEEQAPYSTEKVLLHRLGGEEDPEMTAPCVKPTICEEKETFLLSSPPSCGAPRPCTPRIPVIYSILYSDATEQRGMDKNIGEQLNKAYEAFRQACMDRDSAVRELQQKVRRQEVSSPRKETSPRSLGIPLFHERAYIEKTFQDLKEEFHRICMLAKAQKDHLSKLNVPATATETQCSLPIQCTDKTDKQEVLFKPQAKDDINRGAQCVTSVTPRGLGRDEEDTSFESLSKFNVKFPPTDNDSTFLHSTPERPNILGPVVTETSCHDKFNKEFRDNPGNFVKTEETLFQIQGIDPIASAIQNLKITDKTKPSNLVNTCIRTSLDRVLCLPPGNHNALYVNTLLLQDPSDVPFASFDSPGKAIRGPQQPIWKPFPNQDSDLSSVLGGRDSELPIPRVCEFCQAVFPPSITSRGDFLRHLNSHFNGET
ncbi:TRAF family member-associated NF-kappa-B activator isoform X3 [Canis lupus baileyi]|uniref:TRAF family member-associated NF-kappa-B activator isoform X1 n=1 Tax=Canis lupus familiaris TaxID=9615 RepID=UPI0018F7DB0B|nr:TRAF family member-associated NF-kappa-B activator isoform X1 [Canis lupus familiaris]